MKDKDWSETAVLVFFFGAIFQKAIDNPR